MKDSAIFAGSFLCCHAALANSHLQLCCLVDIVLEAGKAASPFNLFAFTFFINPHENYFVVYCVVDDAVLGERTNSGYIGLYFYSCGFGG